MKDQYPIYLQDFYGKVQIKRLSPYEHSVIYYFASEDGCGHYERSMDMRLSTSEFDLAYFATLEESNEKNFLTLAKVYSNTMLQMASILLESSESRSKVEDKQAIEL